jgi:hypothetical protein
VADCRLPFADEVAQLHQQRPWLIDWEHLLDPSHPGLPEPRTSRRVARAVDRYLKDLLVQVARDPAEAHRQVAAPINQTFRHRWWGLFRCYDVAGLPRTNNDLERFMRRIKTGQRRVSGHQAVQDFLLRYGRCAAYVDYRESEEELWARLRQVSQDDFLRERQALNTGLLREQKRHRFRHHQPDYLRELENRWAAAVEQAKS